MSKGGALSFLYIRGLSGGGEGVGTNLSLRADLLRPVFRRDCISEEEEEEAAEIARKLGRELKR